MKQINQDEKNKAMDGSEIVMIARLPSALARHGASSETRRPRLALPPSPVEDANPRDFFVPSLLGLHVILPLLFPNCKDSHGRSTSTCLEKTGPQSDERQRLRTSTCFSCYFYKTLSR